MKRREKREKREKEIKREKRREKERKDVQGQLLSISIQFAKIKSEYIGRNAQNFKKWLRGSIIDHYKSSSLI